MSPFYAREPGRLGPVGIAYAPSRGGSPVRVATNVALDTVRRRRRAADRGLLLTPTPPSGEDGRAAIVELLSGLPLRQRQVMTLRIVMGLSEGHIADLLEISSGTVRRYAFRAAEHRDHGAEAWLS